MARDNLKHEIDGTRLRKAVELTGMSMGEASLKIGRNADYLRSVATAGYINSAAEKAVDAILGIPLGMYLVTRPKAAETPEGQGKLAGLETPEGTLAPTAWMTYDELNRCVFNAVYGAINKASIDGII